MGKCLFFLTVLSSLHTFSSGFCYSHGQCQSVADETTACFKVRLNTGACEIRCNTIYAGSFCDFLPNKKYGKCKDESFKNDNSDTTDCANAIPEEIYKDQ